MNPIQKWLQKVAGKKEPLPELEPSAPIPPHVVAILLNVWLEQAESLMQLRMHDHANKKMNLARGVTLESMHANPSDPWAWVNIGRVQLVDEKFDSATEVFEHAITLAQQEGMSDAEDAAGAGLFQVRRRQGAALDDAPLDLDQPLNDEQVKQYNRETLEQMCYVCQCCGQLNLMLGEHCAHCRFAPETLDQVRLSIAMSAMHFKTQTLLKIALKRQQGENPYVFIDGITEALQKIDPNQGILEKIQRNAEDDHLDFKAWDKCHACGKKVWASSAATCPHCNQPLDRPKLLQLAICVHRLLSQWIWTVHTSEASEFEQFVLLLVNLKYQLIRQQQGPTDAQRRKATQLLLKLSPLYAQNRGGRVLIQSPTSVLSEVIDPSLHKDIGPTMDYLRDEVKHFLHLMNDAVSLF